MIAHRRPTREGDKAGYSLERTATAAGRPVARIAGSREAAMATRKLTAEIHRAAETGR